MSCFYPLDGWRSREPNQNGKFPIVFDRKAAQLDSPLKIACGRCIGCRLEYSRNWAIRCMHESSLYDDNCFITLTYDDDHLPENGDLLYSDFQNFMKRLRKRYSPRIIRFYMCAEYGSPPPDDLWNNLGRPHYHALLFNLDFPDKQILDKTDKRLMSW